jgi:putative glutamine amidotransferase
MNVVKPRIAIPQPHSQKPEYNQRTLPLYKHAIEASGGEPVEIPLDASPEEVAKIVTSCQAVVLPGSPADVDPQKFSAEKDPHTADPDPQRDNVDELLLQDAYNMRKPVLGICYGLQSLNVWRSGTLVQHIENTSVPHEAGRKLAIAHEVALEPDSKLAGILANGKSARPSLPVNSSHHQAAGVVGDGLRVSARSADDKVIEAVEGTNPEHFVLAVQWHPERNFDNDPASQSIFKRLVDEARAYHPKSVSGSA